jgi:hypothetical protein
MATPSFWDEFKGEYVKWETPGQVVHGTLMAYERGSYKGNTYPELALSTAEGTRKVSATQANLKRQLADEYPEVGDELRIEYLGEGEAKPGQSPVKLFELQVTRKGSNAPATATDLV